MDQPKTLEAFLQDPRFNEVYDKLILYAKRRVKDRDWGGLFVSRWGRARIDVIAIVNEIIVKLMTATPDERGRHLNDRFPIEAQLKGMIRSEISNQFVKKANTLAEPIVPSDEEDESQRKEKEAVDPAKTPDVTAILTEELEFKQQWLREFIEFVKEPILVKIIEGAEARKSRAEIAASAGLSIQVYESEKKRLLRKREEFAAAKTKARKV